MTGVLIWSDRFFELPRTALFAVWLAATIVILLAVRYRRGTLVEPRSILVATLSVAIVTAGTFGYYKVFRRVMGSLGRNLPRVTLLEPTRDQHLGKSISLRAHAVDDPGALGPIGAVRSIEFWLYHPSFAEQHAGNRESKVLLAAVDGPTPDDLYEAEWACVDPFTPARDGDHGGGDGTRTYELPADSRPYAIQAHGLDDEWRAKPGRPGFSERVAVRFEPCE